MARHVFILERLNDVRQTVRDRVHVTGVDLIDVSTEDDLRILARTRDDRLQLVDGEVLRFVDDDEGVWDRATADVRDSLDLDLLLLEEEVDVRVAVKVLRHLLTVFALV